MELKTVKVLFLTTHDLIFNSKRKHNEYISKKDFVDPKAIEKADVAILDHKGENRVIKSKIPNK